MTRLNQLRILFVEDLSSDVDLAVLELRKEGLQFEHMRVDTRNEFIKAFNEFKPDIIISDYMMPSYNGLQALQDTREFDLLMPFILYTGSINEETAVDCIKAGATDYIIKEHMTRLPFAVKEALEQHGIQIEKRAAELLLKENEEQLQSIFRAASVGIGLVVNRIFMEVNETFCKMIGYTRKELIGQSAELIFATNKEYESVGIEKYRQIAEKGTGSMETRFKCKDGRILNIFLSSTSLDKDDLMKGVTFTVMDITERKRAEEALLDSQHLFLTLAQVSPVGIFKTDLDGNTTYVNPKYLELSGLSSEEAYGNGWLNAVHPEDRGILSKTWLSNFKSKIESDAEYRFLKPDGSIIWVVGKAVPELIGNEVTGYIGTITDITERKQAEKVIQESEEKYRRIFDNVLDLYYETTIEGTIVEVSPSIEILSKGQYHRDDLIGKSMYNFYCDANERVTLISQLKEQGFVSDFEITLKNKDGSLVHCSISSKILIDAQGCPEKIIGSMRDITERKKADDTLKESAEFNSSLLQTIPFGMGIVDNEGTILFMSDNLKRIFGEKAVGKKCWEIYREDKRQCVYCPLVDGIKIGVTAAHESYGIIGGKIFDISHTGIMFDGKEAMLEMFQDITERKLIEQALRESESSLRDAQEIGKMGSWEWDMVTQKDRCSDNYFKILGFKPNEGEPTFELFRSKIHPDDVQILDENFAARIKDKTPSSIELRLIQPDGTFKWIQINISPVLENDKLVKLKGVIIDITERKQAEETLQESEEKFRSIMENSADTLLLINQQGRIVYANKEVLNMLGYTIEEVKSKTIVDLSPADRIDEYLNLFSRALKEGRISFEFDILKKDGDLIATDLNSVLLPNGLLFASCRDITEKKQAKKELLEYRDHLEELVNERTKELQIYMDEIRDLYENAPCGYQSIDAHGKYIRINNTELNWLGYTRDELVDKIGFPDLLTPESSEMFKSTFSVFMKKGELKNLEFEMMRKDGSTFFVSLNATAIYNDDGKFLKSRTTLFDITDRKFAEEALNKAKKEAEEANKAKSEFLANMSHEIRTPMNAVLGYTELLSSSLVDQTQKDYINSIKSSGRSLLMLINDILDLSKIEAGKLDLQYDYIDTYSFFTEFERVFSLKVSEKGLKFILDITSGTPAGIYIDEARLRQIVFNLIGNAVKFTSEGKITLKVFTENPQIVKYSKEKSEELIDLIIEVQDTGMGISKELQEAVFEPFVQERDNKNHGGTGLGLTITRRLTALMGGTINVHSKPGKGSTFTVRVQEIAYLRDFSKTSVDIQIDPSEIVFEKASILIADDVEHNRSYLRDALKNTRLKIVEAEDGITAYKLAKEIVPDLIIADIMMPKMDGFQLLDKIKNDKKLKHIPVIAYSASVLKDQKERIHNSEFAGLLIKPVKVAELYLELMNFLPYKSTKAAESQKPLSEVDLIGEITNLPGLIHSLETDFYTTWKTFAVRQSIGEIRDFGKNLIQSGMDHNSSIITGYGRELISAADSFNIEAILKLIGKYKGIIERLKGSTKNLNND